MAVNRLAAAVVVVRPGPGGEALLVGLRRAQSLTAAGYWTFVCEPLMGCDSPALPKDLSSSTAIHPPEREKKRILDALGLSAQRALALHEGGGSTTSAQGPANASRQPLVARQRSAIAGPTANVALPSAATPLVPLGGWRAPPFVARPTDVGLFGARVAADAAAELDAQRFAEGRFVAPQALYDQWQAGSMPLGALEIEVLRTWLALAKPAARGGSSGDDAGRWATFALRWQQLHPSMEQVVGRQPDGHRVCAQAPCVEALPVRSPTLPPATHTNCYAVGRAQVAVIDPGTPDPNERAKLLQWLEGRQAAGSAIEQVWITHHHADHIGAAVDVRRRFGARVLAHRLTAEALVGQVPVDEAIEDEQWLSLGDVGYRALFTPGHARGHLCFFDEKRGHLFSGDNVLGTGTSIDVPTPDGDMRAYMGNLQRLVELRARLLFPGHGPPSARPLDRILDTLRQRQARERRLVEIVEESGTPLSLEALLARLYRGIAPAHRRLAALSLRAHIEKLVAERRVALCTAPDGTLEVGLYPLGGAPTRPI